jgi:hypothetical protein
VAITWPVVAIGVGGPAAAGPRRSEATPAPVSAPDEVSARTAARRTGRQVEVAGLRTETREVYANPTGRLTLRQHARPVRVRDGDGWLPVDPTLRRRADGSVAPVATQVDLVLSGGGDGPLLRVGRGGGNLALSWPGRLPAPVLDEASATYREVLPGVDLRVTADVAGYSQVLVVKDAAAARNPALRTLRFGARTEGASVRVDPAGNLSVLNDRGELVLHGPTPQMWDSSPGEARQARMGVAFSGDELAVVPDQALLTDPATRFPVYLDPYLYYPAAKSAWTHVTQHFSTTSYYNSSGDAKVGHYNDSSASPSSDTYRALFKMDIGPVTGRQIFSATFAAYETYSFSCTKRDVQLWETGAISSASTWSKQPAWTRRLDTVSAAKGWGSGCPAGGVDFNATPAVVDAAANRSATVNLGLRAASESDSYGWKKFKNNPTLTVEYNSVPQVPSALRVAPSYACAPGADRAPAVPSTAPTLIATVTDPDSGQQSVAAAFELAQAGTTFWSYRTAFKQASNFTATAPALTDGAGYAFRVRADDGIAQSAWTDWCHFRVDSSAPSLVPAVTSGDYPEADPANPVRRGGVGKPGTFTFTANGIADVASYRYDVDNPQPATAAAATGTDRAATVSITPGPSESPLRTLYVRSVDSAGNLSAVRAYDFYLNLASAPVGYWRMDEGSGTALGDSSGNGRAATVTGGTWSGGRLGSGITADETALADKTVTLSGGGQYAATSGPVIRTDTSYTVSAWVRLKTTTANATVLTQAGATNGGFQLYYSTTHGWVFNRHATDATGTTIVRAISTIPYQANRWTHLAGVYDLTARQLRLYVNGALAGSTSFDYTPWNATGPLQIGRLKYNGAFQEYWPGDLDEVRVYDRVVYPDEIAEVANRPAAVFGQWGMDEGTGTSVADDSGRSHPLTAGGGVSWVADRFGVPAAAVATNGTTGYLATSAPLVDTDRSFSVACWVNASALPTTWATVASQDGSYNSGFYLQYSPASRKWALSMSSKDASGDTATRVYSRQETVVGRWTHLVGVYDAAARQIRLYVDGELTGTAAFTTAWQANGPMQIGRTRYGGGYGNYWPGAVDDMRVYTGVLSRTEIDNLALS